MSKLYNKYILNSIKIEHNPQCKACNHSIIIYKCIPAHSQLDKPFQYTIKNQHGTITTDNVMIGYDFSKKQNFFNNNMSYLKIVDRINGKPTDPSIQFESDELNIYVYDYMVRGYFFFFTTDCDITSF